MGVCEGEVGSAEGEVQGQLPPGQDRGGEISMHLGGCSPDYHLRVGRCHALNYM